MTPPAPLIPIGKIAMHPGFGIVNARRRPGII